jgi:hypothetical protein
MQVKVYNCAKINHNTLMVREIQMKIRMILNYTPDTSR